MSDIVERLKELTTGGHVYYKAAERIGEAAAEITRLREALAEAEKVIKPIADKKLVSVYEIDHVNAARRWMEGRK